MSAEIKTTEQVLFSELSQLIEQSKRFVIQQANSVLTMLFWNVGRRINESILQNKRAYYGKKIVATVARQLSEKYGKNFELRNLRRMMQFAEQFPDIEIVSPLATQLSWTHFVELMPLKTSERRLFYATEAAERHWGKRELRRSIERKEYERTEIANLQVAAADVVAQYWTELPPKALLEQKVREIVAETKERFARENRLPKHADFNF